MSLKEKAARHIKLHEKGNLDSTRSLITAVSPSRYSMTLTLSPALHGT